MVVKSMKTSFRDCLQIISYSFIRFLAKDFWLILLDISLKQRVVDFNNKNCLLHSDFDSFVRLCITIFSSAGEKSTILSAPNHCLKCKFGNFLTYMDFMRF